MKSLRRVSPEERRAYRASAGAERAWRRPTKPVARNVWAILEPHLFCTLDDLLPAWKLDGDDYDRAVLTAKQSLVVALDAAITAGDRGAMLTKNLLFDALAQRWSPQYRRARRKGVRISYDMLVAETVERALRELRVAGLRFETLWGVVAGPWSRSGLNPLYSVRLVRSQGHPRGYAVDVLDSDALRDFENAVESDTQYRRPGQKWPLLLADDWKPQRRPVRQWVCEEQPYNVVALGPGSERALSILEGAWVQFNVEVFRDDYETLRDYLKIHPRPSTRSQRRNHRRLENFVSSYRRVYKQTDAIPVETADEWVQWGDQPHQGGYKPEPLPRQPWIRSRFFRGLNRRFHARNFWPERVHKEFRERWFSIAGHVPEQVHAEPGGGPHEPWEHSTIEAHAAPGHYVERDVVTSQIQTLAVFLGIRELEERAVSEHPTLKEWLADRLWTQHLETDGGLLANGYEEPQNGKPDDRLVAFAKAHLIRFYGGDLSKIIRKCGRDEGTYGPGWRTSRGLWAKPTIKPGTKTILSAKSGVSEAVDRATEFFVGLPPWTDDLETFLVACRTLAERKDSVVFPDPLDGTEFRWNHAQRGTKRVGHYEIEVRPAGKDTKRGFVPLPAGTIDQSALARFIAPCFTHGLDSTFSAFVIEKLKEAGITDVVALHDAWILPETLPVPDDPKAVLDGRAALGDAIEAAGEPWLWSLKGVYDQLVAYLGDDPTFGGFVRKIQNDWRGRVEAENWPKFLSR